MPHARHYEPTRAHPLCLLAALLGSMGVALMSGCASPLEDKRDTDLRRSIRQAREREVAEASDSPEVQTLVREDRIAALRLKPEILDQLEKMAGPTSYAGHELPLGPDLYGKPQKVVRLTMERAITSSVEHNLDVQFARLAPDISQQQYIAADAAFDWVVFVNSQYTWTDAPRVDSSSSGFPTGVNTDKREVTDVTAGLRKPLIAGGTLTLQSELTNTSTKTPGVGATPNPAREANFVIQLDQPLLRNFGSDVTLAQVRLARNAELDSIAQLKTTLLRNVDDTEQAYWNLVRASWDLHIVQRLLERGEDVANILRQRAIVDAPPAAISNAVATVESRRADVIRAQRVLRSASDALKNLMNDPDFPVGSETLLLPADQPIDQPVAFSLIDSVNAAIAGRPEVQRALLSIDNTSIRQIVADNQRLPRLDLRALTRFSGLGDNIGTPYSQLGEGRFIDYQIGVNFEQPAGNRAAEATYRQRRLERMQATIAYANTIKGIVNDVKGALRDLATNYVLIAQTKTARVAAAEDLRTLLVAEQTNAALTPEFLNLKLQRQQALASTEQQEITALTDYNLSMARLYSATGTALERNKIRFNAPNVKQESGLNELFPDFPLEPVRPTLEEIEKK